MIYQNKKDFILFNGKSYAPGDLIFVNSDVGLYGGLRGTITEIRTDSDKTTDNEGPELHCCLDEPDFYEGKIKVEKMFSEAYKTTKKLYSDIPEEDITLDLVIFSPDCVTVDFEKDCELGFYSVTFLHNESLPFTVAAKDKFFTTPEEAKRYFAECLEIGLYKPEEKKIFDIWKKSAQIVCNDSCFFAIDNEKRVLVGMVKEVTGCVETEDLKEFVEICKQKNDFYTLVDIAKRNCSEKTRDSVIQSIDLEYFRRLLDKNDAYADAYWEVANQYIDDIAFVVAERMKRGA